MKNVRVDVAGDLRCWNCGAKGFTEKRTLRSKAMVGVGALMTKKKLKCQTCGEYNDTGNADTFTGPADRKHRKQWEKAGSPGIADPNAPQAAATEPLDPAAELAKYAGLRDQGIITDDEFAAKKAQILGL